MPLFPGFFLAYFNGVEYRICLGEAGLLEIHYMFIINKFQNNDDALTLDTMK